MQYFALCSMEYIRTIFVYSHFVAKCLKFNHMVSKQYVHKSTHVDRRNMPNHYTSIYP